jgi:hypothetical protein
MHDAEQAIGVIRKRGVLTKAVGGRHVLSLEIAVQAHLPDDYKQILTEVGYFAIEASPTIEVFDPASICAYAFTSQNLQGLVPTEWCVLPIGHYGQSDYVGYCRNKFQFGPELYLLKNGFEWFDLSGSWHTRISVSLATYVVERLDQKEGQ